MKPKYGAPGAGLIIFAFCTLLLLMPLGSQLDRQLARDRAALPVVSELGGIFRVLEIAGLNSLLADVLWLKADEMWHSSSWWEMAPILEAVVRLDSKFPLAWKVLAWHYGWNLNSASTSAVEKAQWLDKASETYQRALQSVPDDEFLWSDACLFFVDRSRQWDKAEVYLKQAIKKYPDEIELFRRRLQRIYEKTWRVDDAVGEIKGILQIKPDDPMAKRDLLWWETWDHNENWRWILEYRENLMRERRQLPWFNNPFEGTLVAPPPWRDKNAIYYMDPNWQPDITAFQLRSVMSLFQTRPDLREQWQKAHPNEKIPEAVQ
jgi:tetratricopeptide (TPR) repeat protein